MSSSQYCLMRVVKVKKPLLPLDSGTLHLNNSSGNHRRSSNYSGGSVDGMSSSLHANNDGVSMLLSSGHNNRLSALAVHEGTRDFCSVASSVTITGRQPFIDNETPLVDRGNNDFVNINSGTFDNIAKADIPLSEFQGGAAANFNYVSDGRRWKILSLHASSDDNGETLTAECERVKDDAVAFEDEAVLKGCERRMSKMVEQLESLRQHCKEIYMPSSVWEFMPEEGPGVKDYDYLAAQSEVAIWSGTMKRRRSIQMANGGIIRGAFAREDRKSNPYKVVQDKYDIGWRRELFSFAVAQLCGLKPIERIALMSLFDTLGRDQFLLDKLNQRLLYFAAEAECKKALK